jgi:NAD(P)H-hydrate repair Nnr-like enzyme with NAD(P)H-hydrate epimerase domain
MIVSVYGIGLDGAIGVECRSAATPRTVLEADVFIDGVFGLGHAQILRNLVLSCGDFLGF